MDTRITNQVEFYNRAIYYLLYNAPSYNEVTAQAVALILALGYLLA